MLTDLWVADLFVKRLAVSLEWVACKACSSAKQPSRPNDVTSLVISLPDSVFFSTQGRTHISSIFALSLNNIISGWTVRSEKKGYEPGNSRVPLYVSWGLINLTLHLSGKEFHPRYKLPLFNISSPQMSDIQCANEAWDVATPERDTSSAAWQHLANRPKR